ncbi:MAG: HAD-IA family hydrolase [Chloroflexi bacterium]|nr:HAD-IA family hydrolase [Chloroflexota bacterium]
MFGGVIFDVDGVLLASPHERAWRESLNTLMSGDWKDLAASVGYDPSRFTTTVYQEYVAGKPRVDGARAALEYFGVPDAAMRAVEYGAYKQRHLLELVDAGDLHPFPDALRFLLALKARGIRIAAASSSKNANDLMRRIRMDSFAHEQGISQPSLRPGATLVDMFDANTCGRDLPRGKPDPAIFLLAAHELGVEPAACVVVEDASSGVEAAKNGDMAAIGVARLNDEALLRAADADLVVTSLDAVSLTAFEGGRLEASREAASGRVRGHA